MLCCARQGMGVIDNKSIEGESDFLNLQKVLVFLFWLG
jgi:hypothetical protein